jgi:quaternary ammonium compound-resistance protein SugE
MAWTLLFIAGLFETAWAVGLKYTEGFTRPLPSLLTGASIVVSMALLGIAARELPIGTAYAVWVGTGALGTAFMGVVLFGEPLGLARFGFIIMLLGAIIGLRLTSGSAA